MRREEVPAELVELAQLHGIDIDTLPTELTDEHLEGVVGGKDVVVMGRPGWGGGWGGFGGWGGGWGRPWGGFYRPWGPRWWW